MSTIVESRRMFAIGVLVVLVFCSGPISSPLTRDARAARQSNNAPRAIALTLPPSTAAPAEPVSTATPQSPAAPPQPLDDPAPAAQAASAAAPPAVVTPPAELAPPPQPPTPAPTPPPSGLERNQLIVYYGTPLSPDMGVLGTMSPADAAASVAERARRFDERNGDTGAIGALDLIYSMAQSEPAEDGLYIRHLSTDIVQQYLDVARKENIALFLDLQIGRASVLDEVRNIEPFLLDPNVHVALDPEYAVGPDGVPVVTPGRISGDTINEVQTYLQDLTRARGLPPKMLVVHQYMQETVVDGDRVASSPGVDLVLNVDAFGPTQAKVDKYQAFSATPWSQFDALTVFLRYDDSVMSEDEILALSPVPRVIFYQ